MTSKSKNGSNSWGTLYERPMEFSVQKSLPFLHFNIIADKVHYMLSVKYVHQ